MKFDNTEDALKLDDIEDAGVGSRTEAPTRGMIRPFNLSRHPHSGRAAPDTDRLPTASDEGPHTTPCGRRVRSFPVTQGQLSGRWRVSRIAVGHATFTVLAQRQEKPTKRSLLSSQKPEPPIRCERRSFPTCSTIPGALVTPRYVGSRIPPNSVASLQLRWDYRP